VIDMNRKRVQWKGRQFYLNIFGRFADMCVGQSPLGIPLRSTVQSTVAILIALVSSALRWNWVQTVRHSVPFSAHWQQTFPAWTFALRAEFSCRKSWSKRPNFIIRYHANADYQSLNSPALLPALRFSL
jgi:hypothetical protein